MRRTSRGLVEMMTGRDFMMTTIRPAADKLMKSCHASFSDDKELPPFLRPIRCHRASASATMCGIFNGVVLRTRCHFVTPPSVDFRTGRCRQLPGPGTGRSAFRDVLLMRQYAPLSADDRQCTLIRAVITMQHGRDFSSQPSSRNESNNAHETTPRRIRLYAA